jgi:hypothetical protein
MMEATVIWIGRPEKTNRTGSWHGPRREICPGKTNGTIGFGVPQLECLQPSPLVSFLAESMVPLVEARKQVAALAPPLA